MASEMQRVCDACGKRKTLRQSGEGELAEPIPVGGGGFGLYAAAGDGWLKITAGGMTRGMGLVQITLDACSLACVDALGKNLRTRLEDAEEARAVETARLQEIAKKEARRMVRMGVEAARELEEGEGEDEAPTPS